MSSHSLARTGPAEIELSYRRKVPASLCPKIGKSAEAYAILFRNWNKSKIEFIEQFKILILNRANRAVGEFEVSSGGSSSCTVDPKLVFAAAIKTNAAGIILAHNHPSGMLKPSEADIKLTRQIVEAGNLLGISVLDHIIVTGEGYYSFGDEGLI